MEGAGDAADEENWSMHWEIGPSSLDFNPELEVALHATVGEGHLASESWEVTGSDAITGLFVVNEVVNTAFGARFHDSLPMFFETLLATDLPYRVAFSHSVYGVVDGPVPYIDQTMSAADATEIALEMVEDASGDNDYLLNALDLGVDANADWLLVDDDVAWSGAKLNLVGINSDQEQSSGNATPYLNHYFAKKVDPGDIAVHGIGGDVTAGCFEAEAFTPFADAAVATGGTFLSICYSDWTANMEALARSFVDEGQFTFHLGEVPVASSLVVSVDGVVQASGWEFSAAGNAVYFDPASAPPLGAQVKIEYAVDSTCDP